ncbi:MAG TPA: periplasmic heavy metal sensor [Thermoanaerobaculia bacterium]
MKRWWLVIVLLLSLGVNVGIVAALVGHRWIGETSETGKSKEKLPDDRAIPLPNGQEGVPQRVVRLADQLGLEGDQRRKFISLQGGFFADTLKLRTDQAETQRELRRELAAPAPSQARIDSLLQESGNTFMALEKAMTQNVVESRKLLKPDQERKFLKLLARLRFGQGGQGGQGEGQGQGQPGQPRRPRRQEPPPPPPSRQDGPPPDDMDGPPDRPSGPEGQEPPPPQGQGPRNQGGAPLGGGRQRRQGMGLRARGLNRRFGGGQGQGGQDGQGGRQQGPPPPGDAGPPP